MSLSVCHVAYKVKVFHPLVLYPQVSPGIVPCMTAARRTKRASVTRTTRALGMVLGEHKKAAGLSYRKLEDETGIDKNQIMEYLRGTEVMDLWELEALAKALRQDPMQVYAEARDAARPGHALDEADAQQRPA